MYILPEIFVQIPFEIFRTFKRAKISLYETPEEQKGMFRKEYEEIYFTEEIKNTSLSLELIKYISRHFYDSKIANPDMKEIYLTRLNVMLQYDSYIRMFEKHAYSCSNLIPLMF